MKEIFKYLSDLRASLTGHDITEYGLAHKWNTGFTSKMAEWADKVASRGRVVVDILANYLINLKSTLRVSLKYVII